MSSGSDPVAGNSAGTGACQVATPATAAVSHNAPPAASGGHMDSDLRQGVSETAHRVLDELDELDGITDQHAAFGRAHGQIAVALCERAPAEKAARFEKAAAALIRSAELLRTPLHG